MDLNPFHLLHSTATKENTVSTTPVVPVVKQTWLSHLGSVLRSALHIGEEVAVVAEPFVAVSFPQITPIYTTAIGLATAAEATAVTATGSGPQKLAQVVATLVPQAQKWATANGIDWPEDQVSKWASAVVDSLNLIPAPTKVATPTS